MVGQQVITVQKEIVTKLGDVGIEPIVPRHEAPFDDARHKSNEKLYEWVDDADKNRLVKTVVQTGIELKPLKGDKSNVLQKATVRLYVALPGAVSKSAKPGGQFPVAYPPEPEPQQAEVVAALAAMPTVLAPVTAPPSAEPDPVDPMVAVLKLSR
jgi:hypothetical protein